MPWPRPSPGDHASHFAAGGRLDHGPRARVLEMPQAKAHRISARGERELVHEGFDREDVGIGAQRAQR